MALAMIYPEAEKAYRGKRTDAGKALETKSFSQARLSQARAVLRHSRALAEDVIQARKTNEDAAITDALKGVPIAEGCTLAVVVESIPNTSDSQNALVCARETGTLHSKP